MKTNRSIFNSENFKMKLVLFLFVLSFSFSNAQDTLDYGLNDPRNPRCPCHKYQKIAVQILYSQIKIPVPQMEIIQMSQTELLILPVFQIQVQQMKITQAPQAGILILPALLTQVLQEIIPQVRKNTSGALNTDIKKE